MWAENRICEWLFLVVNGKKKSLYLQGLNTLYGTIVNRDITRISRSYFMTSVELYKINWLKLCGKTNNSEWVRILKKTFLNYVTLAAKQSKVLWIYLTQCFCFNWVSHRLVAMVTSFPWFPMALTITVFRCLVGVVFTV